MRKLFVLISLVAAALFATANAQVTIPLTATTGGGGIYTVSPDGGNSAAVNQTVNLTLPQVYGIAIDDAANLNFDLGNLGAQTVCVTGIPNDKGQIVSDTAPSGVGQYPLGTFYTVGENFPDISINGGAQIAQYPPIAINQETGAVDLNSKKHIVCYKSFVLEKFSNVPGWDVTVQRADATSTLGNMWVQDNICSAWGGTTGLLPLSDGSTVDLFAGAGTNVIDQTNMTTGAAAASCTYGSPTSWLNDLVVVAIEIDGQQAGTTSSTLTYTIQATQPPVS
ncbi:MAG TPA: hypothetical protein VKB31_00130 [Trueperaceae bacterium]|nr:hypothetical protein [Trueperaceae bacterium]